MTAPRHEGLRWFIISIFFYINAHSAIRSLPLWYEDKTTNLFDLKVQFGLEFLTGAARVLKRQAMTENLSRGV